jgi:hypothetical protein
MVWWHNFETSDALVGLRRLAALTGTAVIQLEANAGALGGIPAKQRDQMKREVLETLKATGVDNSTIGQVESSDRDRDIGDLVGGILFHARQCGKDEPGWITDTQEMYKAWPPSVEAMQRLLDKYSFHDAFTDKALDEYRYFMATGKHRDPKSWADRDVWLREEVNHCEKKP